MNQIKTLFTKKVLGFQKINNCIIQTTCYILTSCIFITLIANAAWALNKTAIGAAQAFVATSTPIAIAFMISILILKITACVLGYLIVKLGHDTLIKGISGEIDFGFSGSGFQTKLKAGSPGALFVLMGAAIIIWGLTVEKPMEIKMLPSNHGVSMENVMDGKDPLHRTRVPD